MIKFTNIQYLKHHGLLIRFNGIEYSKDRLNTWLYLENELVTNIECMYELTKISATTWNIIKKG